MNLIDRSKVQAEATVRRAASYLKVCGIHVPPFELTTVWEGRIGASWVMAGRTGCRLNMGWYPLPFLRHWFAMHELGHVLWHHHRPLRWKRFREAFGTPRPHGYDAISSRESWKTTASMKLSWLPGPHRPTGEPSRYGSRGGGEERFCDLLGLMYAHGDFSAAPPQDLSDLWNTCYNGGLARMVA